MPLASWTHVNDPFIVQFSENFGVRWYGLAYVVGFAAGMWLLHIYYKKGRSPFNPEQQNSLFLAIMAGVVIGGRMGYALFYNYEMLLTEPWKIFYVWEGGMASHGGFIGVAIASWIMAKRFNSEFLKVGDLLATLAPPGLLLGRLANYKNGELWGKVTGSDWGVVFQGAGPEPRHPSQLYEAGLEGLLMLVYSQLRVWKSSVLKDNPGQLAGEFLLLYSIVRVIGEQFREPDAELHFAFLSRGSFLSLIMATIGISIILYARRKKTA